MNKLCLFAIALITLLAAPDAFAKKGKGKAKAPAAAASPHADLLAQYDTNSNKTLDSSERAQLLKDFAADKTGSLKALDSNSDGKLDNTEIAALTADKKDDDDDKGNGKKGQKGKGKKGKAKKNK